MKIKLMLIDIVDTGETVIADWFEEKTKTLIESCFRNDNRLDFLDTMNNDNLKSSINRSFWCSTYIDRNNEIRVRPTNIIPVETISRLDSKREIVKTEDEKKYFAKLNSYKSHISKSFNKAEKALEELYGKITSNPSLLDGSLKTNIKSSERLSKMKNMLDTINNI